MKKKNAVLILLFLASAAGIVIGSYFVYAGQGIFLYMLAGILCYFASVSAAVLICYERKGITGKRLRRARILPAVLSVPLAVCMVVIVLQACGAITIIPTAMQSGNWHPEFSFKEDKEGIDMDSPLVKTAGFVNISEAETEFTFMTRTHLNAPSLNWATTVISFLRIQQPMIKPRTFGASSSKGKTVLPIIPCGSQPSI